MKILWFANTPCGAVEKLNTKDYFGGGWLISLEKELAKQINIELHVAFYWHDDIKSFKLNEVNYHPIYRKRHSKFMRLIRRYLKLLNNDAKELTSLIYIVDHIKPDIIHIHGTEDNFGLLNDNIKTPILISIQGLLSPYFSKLFAGIPKNIIIKNEKIFRKILQKTIANFIYTFKKNTRRERKILFSSIHIMGRTDWDKKITRVLAPKSIYYFGNEILRNVFYSNIWDKNSFKNTIQLITTTSDSFYKGFETIVDAAILMNELNIKFNWKIIGLSNKSEIVRVTTKWKKIILQTLNIELLDSKNENEIVKLMLLSDIYIQTSHIENSPNSLCEAQLLGMPCIATFAGGTNSLINNNENGILVQEGDPYSLISNINYLKMNFEFSKQIAENARHTAKERHDKETICKNLIDVYNIVAGKL